MNNLHPFYENLKRDGVIFCFSGPATQSMVEVVGQTLKKKMEMEEAGMSTVQRVFSLFVEQVQNMINYSAEKSARQLKRDEELRHGIVVVGRENHSFYVLCGNKISTTRSEKIVKRISFLSSLNKEELRKHYKTMRRETPEKESKGAGLGFIEMFRRASEPLEYRVTPIDNQNVFLSIKAKGC